LSICRREMLTWKRDFQNPTKRTPSFFSFSFSFTPLSKRWLLPYSTRLYFLPLYSLLCPLGSHSVPSRLKITLNPTCRFSRTSLPHPTLANPLGRLAFKTYLCIVIEEESSNELVGSATLVVERKFLRGGGMVGHVEDVVVHPRMQGKKLGVSLLKVLTQLGEDLGCYKVR